NLALEQRAEPLRRVRREIEQRRGEDPEEDHRGGEHRGDRGDLSVCERVDGLSRWIGLGRSTRDGSQTGSAAPPSRRARSQPPTPPTSSPPKSRSWATITANAAKFIAR